MPKYSRAFAGKYSPGWLRDHEKCCEATKVGADGVVGPVECLRYASERIRLNDSPVCAVRFGTSAKTGRRY